MFFTMYLLVESLTTVNKQFSKFFIGNCFFIFLAKHTAQTL